MPPFLSTVETPLANGTMALSRNTLDAETGKETTLIDEGGNRAEFDYLPGKTNVRIIKKGG
jgi:hypothetical protein